MTDRSESVDRSAGLRGEVVYLYAFDLAYDMRREPVPSLLGQPTQYHTVGPGPWSPRSVLFYRPQMVVLPPEERRLRDQVVSIHRSIKIFSIGAISIQVRVPFEVQRLEDLVAYHDLTFASGPVAAEAHELAGRVARELRPYCIRPLAQLWECEAYTVFCLRGLPEADGRSRPAAEDWLFRHRPQVAALLSQEADATRLSEQEAGESTSLYLSYYESDLVVVDWDAALVVGEQEDLDQVLHIMELANVQLAELEAYDRLLDSALTAAYQDLGHWRTRTRSQIRLHLREIRVDLARFSDELLNITKFFGDWHLARIYRNVSTRFHIGDWHRIIDEKLKTLGELYEILQQDRINFWMVLLEATIVLLIVLEVALLLLGVA